MCCLPRPTADVMPPMMAVDGTTWASRPPGRSREYLAYPAFDRARRYARHVGADGGPGPAGSVRGADRGWRTRHKVTNAMMIAPHDQTHSVLPAREITEIAFARHGRFTYDDHNATGCRAASRRRISRIADNPAPSGLLDWGRSFDNFLVDDGERNKDGDQSRRRSHV